MMVQFGSFRPPTLGSYRSPEDAGLLGWRALGQHNRPVATKTEIALVLPSRPMEPRIQSLVSLA